MRLALADDSRMIADEIHAPIFACVSYSATAIYKNRQLYAKNREINVFPLRILIKSSIAYNFLKIELILKVSGLN
jgi:hypothetical protein